MKKLPLLLIATTLVGLTHAQDSDSIPKPKKGSYLYYGQPSIEDNSMLIEEAFNQEAGVIQHISNFIYNGGDFTFGYTQEIPLADVKHQFSFGFTYASFKKPSDIINSNYVTKGLGDVLLNYRPLLWGKNDWALVIPRFTIIVPTGNARYGFGQGGWGGQFNLAVTKRLNSKITTNYNAGYTVITKADHYTYAQDGTPELAYEKNIGVSNLGGSAIWLVRPKFNLMVEYVVTFGKEMQDDGRLISLNNSVVNPGFRFAIDVGKIQIVPGFGLPINFTSNHLDGTGAFFYLSIEPAY
ncbi:MAG: transporter [Chryseolinea sp.]